MSTQEIMSGLEAEVDETREWMSSARFADTERLYSAREVVQQRGTIDQDYTVAREAAEQFYTRLRELFAQKQSITTFGPYSPGQAVAMKRQGIEGIYLGGWATSAKGSADEDPGADLASYPLSQVPNEAAVLVRALLTADRNQRYLRLQMTGEELEATPEFDFRPFIIADADTGHGGDPHVRNLIRRFVEVGVPGYHIEDQRPGTKKCGHQGGKVLVGTDEHIKRLNTARFQLDVMGVPGIIVARTDAEAATLLENGSDERDQPFILGATNIEIPSYRSCFLALLRRLNEAGLDDIRGHLLYEMSPADYARAEQWLGQAGLLEQITVGVDAYRGGEHATLDVFVDEIESSFVDAWENEAGLTTFGEAAAEVLEYRISDGEAFDLTVEEWNAFAAGASLRAAMERARDLGLHVPWDIEIAKTPEGYMQTRSGIDFATVKLMAAAPFADVLWMETKTADLADARKFADAIHARYPDKMLAYNLSPSFNWDTTGMNDEEMRQFPIELGKLGFVFNFVTYGGHQIDGVAAEEFSQAVKQDGMLALAKLQRKIRLTESPYRTPQTLVGGPRLDAALSASTGRTATTKAMGKASTQHQHLVVTEVPTKLLEGWLSTWAEHYGLPTDLRVQLRPHRAGSELLELAVLRGDSDKVASVVFATILDRKERMILSVRDQNTFDETLRKKRLMTLIHLFLVHRYKVDSIHYVSPTEDNEYQTAKMKAHGIFSDVHDEIGGIIVAEVNDERTAELLEPDGTALERLIAKKD
ncbi:MAG: isocitrate lyase family protein [Acidimicrobiia bacterium]|nr:isocitrate lyase family protein [Acidimicrobiia bacterium]RZV47153.1 MAG: isocitrate lyase family protein [Acidimicrobiia bacterium]